MLYIIGTGLNNEYDLSLNSIEILKKAFNIYIEYYTSKININIENLQKITNKTITKLYRSDLEEKNFLIEESSKNDICLLIIGTPFFATTHTDLLVRAKENNVKVKIIHNASIMNVMGSYGLYSYSFGRTVSIPFYEKNWKPTSFYNKIYENLKSNLHTLVLLDIRVKEIKKECRFSEIKEYEEERFMNPNTALNQLMECEEIEMKNIFLNKTKIFVISRFGCDDENVFYDSIENLIKKEFGKPLHSIIVPAKLDIVEKEHVEYLIN
ncbi:hypothetical protein GVAV_002226 [Gurleya vavrai]